MIPKADILSFYKILLRESKKIHAYNFRKYALRRIHDGFKQNKYLSDPAAIKAEYEEAQRTLELIKRQVIIGQLYSTDKLVIENVSIH